MRRSSCCYLHVVGIAAREEVIGGHYTAGELADPRHIFRARPAAARLPIVPQLTRCADAIGRLLEGQVLPFPPSAQRVNGVGIYHERRSKLKAYPLTRGCKALGVSTMSAEILHFASMKDAPNRIREHRLAKNKMSQQALGDAIGVSKMTISDLERGSMKLDVEYMRRLSKALDVLPADLLPLQDNEWSLDQAERELIERYRSASAEERSQIQRVTEALAPFRARPGKAA